MRVGTESTNKLVAVLIVTAIIGLLAALMIPVFNRARENAQRAPSQSNLKQVGIGFSGSGADSAAEAPSSPMAAGEAKPQDSEDSGSGVAWAQTVAAIPRKIIYTAEVSLVVEKLTPAQKQLAALVKKHKGYIAETSVGSETGAPRQGRWKVRIPVERYESFMDGVSKLGEVQTLSTSSDDVSEEYYDLQARLRNKRIEERRLIQHLQKSTAKLRDILEVEKEISRVRGEIEQMEGRVRVLTNLTALTTVTITINEIKDYVPPVPPTFGTQITRTFQASFGGLVDFGKGFVLAVVAVLPWLVVLLLIGVPTWRMARRHFHSGSRIVRSEPEVHS